VCHHLFVSGSGEGRASRRGDDGLWFDVGPVYWFPTERRRRGMITATAPSGVPAVALAGGGAAALVPGAFRPRTATRAPGWSPERRHRFNTRFLPTATLAVAAAAAAPWVLHGQGRGAAAPAPPPAPATPSVRRMPAVSAPLAALRATAEPAPATAEAEAPAAPARPEIAWRHSTAVGAPHAGHLVKGVQLPIEGPGWVTWDPARDRSPNRALRLYGTDRLVRMLVSVIEEYEAAHPDAPRLVVGDLSWRRGGLMDQHVSHQNGLDVDVYYPRKDGKLVPATRVSQVDLRLAQDLVDRFAAAGAQIMFVGLHTHLRGPAGVVVPYPNHDDHVHVRIAGA
jgi:hypothetical protein